MKIKYFGHYKLWEIRCITDENNIDFLNLQILLKIYLADDVRSYEDFFEW